MSKQNGNINSLEELNSLKIGQSIEVGGYFSRRGENGATYRTLHLTVHSIDEYSGDRLFIDQEGEKWTSLTIYNFMGDD